MEKILVVDDSPDMIDMYVELLAPYYDIYIALDGKSALSIMKNETIKVVLLDIHLENESGYDVLSKIRKLKQGSEIPVIMVSASSDVEDIQEAFAKGADDYMIKPVIGPLLNRKIDTQLRLVEYMKGYRKVRRENAMESKKTLHVMIENLCEVIESRDYDTGMHIIRAGHYYKILASQLKYDNRFSDYFEMNDLDNLTLASKMHDIGKLRTPDFILRKPGKLTEEEFERIKRHSHQGYKILERIGERLEDQEMVNYGKEIAEFHHERWDGKGYPNGLSGDDIPISSRIMSVVDVYDALTTKRVYKDAIDHKDAMKIIIEERGKAFDPIIVDAFCKVEGKIVNTFLIYKEIEEEKKRAKSFHNEPQVEKTSHVLIVDDEMISRDIMGNQFKNHGFEVTLAKDGKEAYQIITEGDISFDCMISDIEMPRMNGYQLIRRLRKDGNDILAFSITDSDYTSNAERAKENGFNGSFLKPLDFELFMIRYMV